MILPAFEVLFGMMANMNCYMQNLHPDFHNPNKQKGLALVSDKVRTALSI